MVLGLHVFEECFFLHLRVVLGAPPKFAKRTTIPLILYCADHFALPIIKNHSSSTSLTPSTTCITSQVPSCDLGVQFILKLSITTTFYNHLRYALSIVRFVVYLGRFRGICDLGMGYFQTVFVAEPPIPQLEYESICKLGNGLLRNTFGHLPMCCGTSRSVIFIQIHMQVAEWVVPQYIGMCPNVLRNNLFCNLYKDPYTSCGMGGSATHPNPPHLS